jgi:hypothetical protein
MNNKRKMKKKIIILWWGNGDPEVSTTAELRLGMRRAWLLRDKVRAGGGASGAGHFQAPPSAP